MKPKWVSMMVNGYSKEDWELALEETSMQGNWLDYILVFQPLKMWLWQARASAFCRGLEYGRGEGK